MFSVTYNGAFVLIYSEVKQHNYQIVQALYTGRV